jgi:hypothetical protein
MARNVFEAPLWLFPDSLVSKLGIDAEDELRTRSTAVLTYMLSPNTLYGLAKARSQPPVPIP